MITAFIHDWTANSNKLERLWLLAKIEFKLRYYENRLGLLWAFLKPVMDMIIYYVVFKIVIKIEVPAFASYLFIGLILWNFFVESTTGTIQILQTKKYLYEYSNMDKLEIYLSTMVSNTIGFGFNLLMFLIFYNLLEPESVGIQPVNLWMPLIFLNLFILALGISLILSNVFIVAKDITQLWTVFTSMLFFLSPIFYKLSMFQNALPAFQYLNPLAGLIINARRVMMQGLNPDFNLLLFDFCYGIVFLVIGMVCLNKLGAKAAERV
jgi:ABC-type polysaccharide/polyol phosphate export permease